MNIRMSLRRDSMSKYNKLVRDKIPEIIESNGEKPITRILDDVEYNEELRAWKNQTEQKKEKPLEQPKKASVLEKLHRYQQEGRQQPKRSVKKKSMDRER